MMDDRWDEKKDECQHQQISTDPMYFYKSWLGAKHILKYLHSSDLSKLIFEYTLPTLTCKDYVICTGNRCIAIENYFQSCNDNEMVRAPLSYRKTRLLTANPLLNCITTKDWSETHSNTQVKIINVLGWAWHRLDNFLPNTRDVALVVETGGMWTYMGRRVQMPDGTHMVRGISRINELVGSLMCSNGDSIIGSLIRKSQCFKNYVVAEASNNNKNKNKNIKQQDKIQKKQVNTMIQKFKGTRQVQTTQSSLEQEEWQDKLKRRKKLQRYQSQDQLKRGKEDRLQALHELFFNWSWLWKTQQEKSKQTVAQMARSILKHFHRIWKKTMPKSKKTRNVSGKVTKRGNRCDDAGKTKIKREKSICTLIRHWCR
jgi:hypothetical protein